MIIGGLERAPADQFGHCASRTEAGRESAAAFNHILYYGGRITAALGLESDDPYRATESDIEARRAELDESRATSFLNNRDTRDLSRYIIGTVAQIEAEMTGRTLLDIGCGIGRFGERMARNAKSKVTFVDRDEMALSQIGKKAGTKVVADAQSLPFETETFDRTMTAFSSTIWAATPAESVGAFNEALRVTNVGGTSLFIPLFAQLFARYRRSENYRNQPAQKVWALHDHALLKTVLAYVEAGQCSITWTGFVGTNSYNDIDFFSAIVDKTQSIPQSTLDAQLEYARGLEAT